MERWKDIPGYEGIYEASDLGRIRTVKGKTTTSTRHGERAWKQRVLKQKYSSRKGSEKKDARVILWKDKKQKTFLVSRLIARAWVKGYSEGMTVNHIDGNPMNNAASNLEWLSLRDNISHGFRTGLYSTQKPCVLVDSKGNRKQYVSQSEASRCIGRTNSYIAFCLLKKRPIRSISGEVYGLV